MHHKLLGLSSRTAEGHNLVIEVVASWVQVKIRKVHARADGCGGVGRSLGGTDLESVVFGDMCADGPEYA